LIRKLGGIARKLMQRENQYLRNLQKELWEELGILFFKRSYCGSKSPTVNGWSTKTKIIKYFNGITVIRR